MTTQYGERPGLTVDGDSEYWRGKVAECEREIVGLTHERDVARLACENLTAMRDAARAEADRLRAALERVESYLSPMPAEGNMAAAVAFGMVRAALRATESGKDGAK